MATLPSVQRMQAMQALHTTGQTMDGSALWDLLQLTVTDLQRQAETGLERQNQTVEVGQLARSARDELERVKETVNQNDQMTKQALQDNDSVITSRVDEDVTRIQGAGQILEGKVAAAHA